MRSATLRAALFGGSALGASSLAGRVLDSLQNEQNGASFYFKQGTPLALIRDTTTGANNFFGDANSKLVYTSPSTKYVRDANGTYSAGTTLRCDHSSGVPLGLLVEGARTNSLRNNSMQGAVAGTPGTFPTNWGITGTLGTLTQTVVGTGTQNGIEYVDIRFNGTTSSTVVGVLTEATTQIVAASGETWTASAFLALVGGSLNNITAVTVRVQERTAAGAFVTDDGTDFDTSLTSSLQRFSHTRTLSGGGTVARSTQAITIIFSSGVAIDITLRIGWPQLELGAFASSPIRTTTAAVTRAADNISLAVANFPSMASGGYMTARWVPGQITANANAVTLYQGAGDRVEIRQTAAGAKRSANVVSSAEVSGLTPTGSLAIGTATTVCYMFASANYKTASGGGAVQTATSVGSLPTFTQVSIGALISVSQPLFGHLQWAKIVPRTNLTDAQVVTESTLAL